MENKYLAKTEKEKTIKEHTEDLVKQYQILKELYPNILDQEEWEVLEYAIKYHDLGKISTKFQNKLYKVLKYDELLEDKIEGEEIFHNFLSPLFINTREFVEKYGKQYTQILISSVYYHHSREEREFNLQEIKEDLEKQLINFGDFYGIKLEISKTYPNRYILKPTNIKSIITLESKKYIMIKGLLNKIDYVASLDKENVNVEENVLNKDKKTAGNLVQEMYNGKYRPVQKYMFENKKENLIVISPTGSGKTEASLLWTDNSKLFYTLPLKVSINAIYERIVNEIQYEKALLLHSDAYTYYMEKNNDLNYEESIILYDRARRMSAPLIVTTVDQIFKIAFKYKGYEEILATLSYSKVVLDEIQMYSPQMLAYILIGLKMITAVGGKFAIVTATFPPVLYDLMDNLEIKYKKQSKYFPIHLKNRHKIKVFQNEDIDIEKIKEFSKDKKVLVIVNTVKKAQQLYDELSEENTYLLHSNYTKEDRKLLEDSILQFTKIGNAEKGIWISTQIVEASLDIDFDVLFTDMCTIDSLFQRMGRVFRKREYESQIPNVYIYDTKNGIKGKKHIIDPEIYKYSLKEIIKYDNQNLSEDDKIIIIDNIFDSKLNNQLINSEYYKEINNTIELFDETLPNEFDKNKIDKLFRNIQNISLIPDNIYENLYKEGTIESWKEIINQKGNSREKIRIKDEINKNVINISWRKYLEYDAEEQFYSNSNIYRTRYKYDFDKKTLKGKGLIIEKIENCGYFDE